jgi:Mg-chelatase subunit ChlD
MKTKLIALAIFTATAATVALYPAQRVVGAIPAPDPALAVAPIPDPLRNERAVIEAVFVLDTTGSMSGLIQAAKEKIWSIATTMASAQPAPEIRMGLVAYRDRGDAYVTRVVDLSADLDSVYATLMDLKASGGGDGPESVNEALHDAVHRISWSQEGKAYKVVFLVGDAPPHLDYPDDVKYPQTLAAAREKGIVVNAVQCGSLAETTRQWEQIADLGQGRYFRVDPQGSAVAVATPYDRALAELSAKLDATRLNYGNDAEKKRQAAKQAATDKLHAAASVESRARRATFNASAAGKANLLGEKDLVEDVASGRVDLSTVNPATLPAPLQAMAPAEREAAVQDQAERRKVLTGELAAVAKQRAEFLERKVSESGGAKESLDEQIYGAVREQAAAKGFRYEADAPAY